MALKIILTILISTCSLALIAQKQIGKVTFNSYKLKAVMLDEDGRYNLDTEWMDSTTTIVVDFTSSVMTVYNSVKSNYILQDAPIQSVDGEFTNIKWDKCIDNNGERCNVRIKYKTTGNFKNDITLLFLDFKDVTLVYKMKYRSS